MGSSPRVRGKRRVLGSLRDPTRLIPARAGKTPRSTSANLRTWAHPRACGENALVAQPSPISSGSSPRVRGKRPVAPRGRPVGRLIPARAGKTSHGAKPRPWRSAHPRACGENRTAEPHRRRRWGSSPRVRGKPSPTTPPSTSSPAHPRACGENCWISGPGSRVNGSSPRVRGKRGPRPGYRAGTRLIPARAGKTRPRTTSESSTGAHPRACGENLIRQPEAGRPRGSSPRVRGKRDLDESLREDLGLIPARAGKTRGRIPGSPPPRAHPRACGENQPEDGAEITLGGSSPRVRGKRWCGAPAL